MRARVAGAAALALAMCFGAGAAHAEREPVLNQVKLPHSYYWRELYLPQLTTGPSSVAWMPDSKTLIYSMGGSLWRQGVGPHAEAWELTHPRRAYDYQPDVTPDGRSVVFVRYDGKAMELRRLDLASGREEQLTSRGAVNVEPRISPDGKRIAFVSTRDTGHFNLFVADFGVNGITNIRYAVQPHKSDIGRYYYSPWDMALNPSWSPDGKRIYYVGNLGAVWGTGDIWSVSSTNPADRRKVLSEETSWSARPEPSPDGHRVLFASYHGRQSRQLWLTTPTGTPALPMTFGDYDISGARWSLDGSRIAYISNEHGGTELVVREIIGGKRTVIPAVIKRFKLPMARLTLRILDENRHSVPARVVVNGSDGRAVAPDGAWMHADDGFDRVRQPMETQYFHCDQGLCLVDVPAGETTVQVQLGFRYLNWKQNFTLAPGQNELWTIQPTRHDLPVSFGKFVSADLHVHMNYGGTYRNTPVNLARQARAEDLNAIYNLIVNKEERIPDIGYFSSHPDPVSGDGVLIMHSQEHHTSHWGHLGLLGLNDHYIMPEFTSYAGTPFISTYPHNGVIADLAHAQGALVGYVHPFDPGVDFPAEGEANMLPADVAAGKVDYIEIVGFADHKITAEVWYRLLNLGFRLPAGAGTDAMANYASVHGPVGLDRVFLDTGGKLTQEAVQDALKAGRTFATNGPLLGLDIAGEHPGGIVKRNGPTSLHYKVALRSFVPVDHLELVYNGHVVKTFALTGDRRTFDDEGEIQIPAGGWVVLRAYNDHSDPLVLDTYPYATTSPVYVELPGGLPPAPQDAAYFAAWLERMVKAAEADTSYNTAQERIETVTYLRNALAWYRARMH